jgi:acyl carrier protein
MTKSFDFLEVFNAVSAAQKAVTADYIVAESLDVPITEDATNLDSLDVTLIFFVLGEAYGIPGGEEMDALWPISSIGALNTFLQEYKTKDPESEYDNVKALVKDLS